jgi:hypothetical protein
MPIEAVLWSILGLTAAIVGVLGLAALWALGKPSRRRGLAQRLEFRAEHTQLGRDAPQRVAVA